MNTNAKECADDAIGEVLTPRTTLADLDLDTLRDEARDRIEEVIYPYDGYKVISRYEHAYGLEAEERCEDREYRAAHYNHYNHAMMAYANAIWYCAVSAAIDAAIERMTEEIDEFRDAVADLGGDPDETRLECDCAYGWAAHNYETADGTMFWNEKRDMAFAYNPEKLEGELQAVSKKLDCGLWLNLCWRPETEEEDE